MAKKKTSTDTPADGGQAVPSVSGTVGKTDAAGGAFEKSPETSVVKKKTVEAEKTALKAMPAIEEIPEHVKGVLKAFSDHPKLYVSESGAVFLPGTEPSVRGNAVLYKNIFYNSKNNQQWR